MYKQEYTANLFTSLFLMLENIGKLSFAKNIETDG